MHGRTFWSRNGLSLALLVCFLLPLAGQAWFGHQVHNQQLVEDGGHPLSLLAYLHSGHFVSAVFENWESEFLQMGMYVLLTVSLRQRGSAESRPLDPADEDTKIDPGPAPWPVRKGGGWKTLYGYSLSLAFGLLFLISFVLHLCGSWRDENLERALKGEAPLALIAYLGEPRFWFESLQNWQSEFLAVLSLVLLSIWLRQKDSPQSKPVEAPHSQTGG